MSKTLRARGCKQRGVGARQRAGSGACAEGGEATHTPAKLCGSVLGRAAPAGAGAGADDAAEARAGGAGARRRDGRRVRLGVAARQCTAARAAAGRHACARRGAAAQQGAAAGAHARAQAMIADGRPRLGQVLRGPLKNGAPCQSVAASWRRACGSDGGGCAACAQLARGASRGRDGSAGTRARALLRGARRANRRSRRAPPHRRRRASRRRRARRAARTQPAPLLAAQARRCRVEPAGASGRIARRRPRRGPRG